MKKVACDLDNTRESGSREAESLNALSLWACLSFHLQSGSQVLLQHAGKGASNSLNWSTSGCLCFEIQVLAMSAAILVI